MHNLTSIHNSGGCRSSLSRYFLLLLCAVFSLTVSAQSRLIRGTVKDAAGEPLIGVSVMVRGTSNGTMTDIDGRYSINAKKGDVLGFSYVGFIAESVTVGNNDEINVTMKEEISALDEVVVVAYGTQKRSSITGAISQVNSDEIAKRPVTSVTAALEGMTSGITTTSNYGVPGESASIQIRGVGTVNGTTTPLYVVDGVPYGGNISDLNPDDIESMSVLKDAASAALYGNRASNGVILITTKKSKSDRCQITFKTNHGWYERGLKEYETASIPQFMNLSFQDMLGAYIGTEISRTDAAAMSDARQYVRDNIVKSYLYTNIFNAKDNELFDANGNFTNAAIKSGYAGDLDWWDQTIRNGYRGEYFLSGSGATERSDYYFSLGYLSEDGYMRDASFDRFSGRAAINISPVKWFKAGFSINATHQKISSSMNGAGDGSTSYNNPMYFCRYVAPIYPVHAHDPFSGEYILDGNGEKQWNVGHLDDITLSDGNYYPTIQTDNRTQDRHVIYESIVNSDKTIRNTINSIAYADFMLPYGFTLTFKGNLNTRNSEQTKMGSSEIGDYTGMGGRIAKTSYVYKNYTLQEQLHWNHSYGKNYVDVLLGHENYDYHYDYTYLYKTAEAFSGIPALSNYSTMGEISGYRNRYRTESYLARVRYNYDERYNIEASFRRDGSSRFAKDTRWGNFGSIGANWVFSNEEFMKGLSWLNNGKLRVDWGQVGNDDAADYYAYYALYTASTNASLPAYYLYQNAANTLKWETGESWGVALEARLFNRWNISLEYYDKRNKDLLFNVYAPTSTGSTATTDYTTLQSSSAVTMSNIGTISNRGIEINTDVDIFANRDWTVNIGANLTTLKNKVVKLPEQNKDGIEYSTTRITEGKSRYEWYMYEWDGVDMVTGQSLYTPDLEKYHVVASDGSIIGGTYDAAGNLTSVETTDVVLINGKYYTNTIANAAKKEFGTSLPSVYGSFTGNFRWKNLSLSVLFSYSLGGKVYDSVYKSLMTTSGAARNLHVDLLNSWAGTPEHMLDANGDMNMDYAGSDRINKNINPEINTSKLTSNNAESSRWLISRDYWQLKNINLSYSLPKKWINPCGLSSVMLSFAVENLYTHTKRTGMNPSMDMSGSQSNYMVPARVFTFGLNVNF